MNSSAKRNHSDNHHSPPPPPPLPSRAFFLFSWPVQAPDPNQGTKTYVCKHNQRREKSTGPSWSKGGAPDATDQKDTRLSTSIKEAPDPNFQVKEEHQTITFRSKRKAGAPDHNFHVIERYQTISFRSKRKAGTPDHNFQVKERDTRP